MSEIFVQFICFRGKVNFTILDSLTRNKLSRTSDAAEAVDMEDLAPRAHNEVATTEALTAL